MTTREPSESGSARPAGSGVELPLGAPISGGLPTAEGLDVSAPVTEEEQRIFVASQWQLIWWRFRRHHLGVIGSVILIVLYTAAVFSDVVIAIDPNQRSEYIYSPPQRIHFWDGERLHLRPFTYALQRSNDPRTLARIYTEDRSERYHLRFWVEGFEYRLFGLFRANRHLFGVEEGGTVFLFGTDNLGRDMLSRLVKGGSISLFVGLLGVALSFFIGSVLGGLSGYLGGTFDILVQRMIEFLLSVPNIPLWMALSASLPRDWTPLRIYFFITLILSLQSWCYLARALRGKVMQQRGEDYVLAARLVGASQWRVLTRHLFPATASHLIVSLTLSIPGMILGETSLSFLGLGLRPPVISWGVLLQQAQNVRTVATNPWLLIPAVFVIITVLSFNFAGDGLRDAADPYVR